MSVLAVIDTNVVVAALRTKHEDAATALVLNAIVEKRVVPLFSPEIIDEYRDVLGRPKFGFDPVKVEKVINLFTGSPAADPGALRILYGPCGPDASGVPADV